MMNPEVVRLLPSIADIKGLFFFVFKVPLAKSFNPNIRDDATLILLGAEEPLSWYRAGNVLTKDLPC
jgi:hypothetical protein